MRPGVTSLAFNFTFAATDADGDALNWTLDANGDNATDASGSTLPGNATYAFAQGGLYNATLRVTDGTVTVEQVLLVNATLGVAGPLATVTFSWTVGSVGCTAWPYAFVTAGPYKHGTPAAGVLWGEIAVPAAWSGHDFKADFGKSGSSVDGAILTFYDGSDAIQDSFSTNSGLTGVPPGSAPSDPMVITGTVSDGAASLMAVNCGAATGAHVTMTVF